jgi:20S proteasome alpha/beta subunit
MRAEIRHKRRITVAAASKILANLTYAYKGYGLSMGTMLAGVRIKTSLLTAEFIQSI